MKAAITTCLEGLSTSIYVLVMINPNYPDHYLPPTLIRSEKKKKKTTYNMHSPTSPHQIDLATYIFTRLHQLGIRSIHGVPGDFNLVALDYISPAGLTWVGNANELNAGYSADGYARIKGISALITAFGVGELSALNAIGGAFAERAAVVHIVGVPSTASQKAGLTMHHSFGDGDFGRYRRVYEGFSCAQVNLIDASTAAEMVDWVLRECLVQSRPVYIELPTDFVQAKVSAERLEQDIRLSLPVPENDEVIENAAIEDLLRRLYAAKQPLIIVDGFAPRYGISEEADELVRITGFPTSTTPFGKGIVNETYPNFHGVYAGAAGKQVYMPWVNSCDLIVRIAPLNADTNTYGYTTLTNRNVTVEIGHVSIEICGALYRDLNIKGFLQKLLSRLDTSRLPRLNPYPDLGNMLQIRDKLPAPQVDAPIDQDTFWLRVSHFFRPGDIVMTETGTPSSGGREFVLPPQTTMINSAIWLSIGYMLAACTGAAIAQAEQIASGTRPPSSRTILFEGDGSFQMSAQSVSDMIRNRANVIIFLINNDGYTIERYIHGMKAKHNWVQPWQYLESPWYFGAPRDDPDYPVFTVRVATWGELGKVLENKQLMTGSGFNMVEVVMDVEDAPSSLKNLVLMVQKRNAGGPEGTRAEKEVEEKVQATA